MGGKNWVTGYKCVDALMWYLYCIWDTVKVLSSTFTVSQSTVHWPPHPPIHTVMNGCCTAHSMSQHFNMQTVGIWTANLSIIKFAAFSTNSATAAHSCTTVDCSASWEPEPPLSVKFAHHHVWRSIYDQTRMLLLFLLSKSQNSNFTCSSGWAHVCRQRAIMRIT